MTPEELIASLKQEVADLKAERAKLKRSLDDREADNKAARDKNKALQEELEATKAALPAEGALVLSGDDVKVYEAYQALGKPNELEVKLGDYDRAVADAAALKRRTLVDKAARDPKNETQYRYRTSVLERLLADATLSETKDGFTVKAGDEEKPLEKWLEEDQADFMPAVTAVPEGTPVGPAVGSRKGGAKLETSVEDLIKQKAARGEYRA